MLGHRIEIMIEQLAAEIPSVDGGPFRIGKVERHDWRPVWALCKKIQEEFRGCRDFPSREQQQAAWERFQHLRQKASDAANSEKEAFKLQSEQLRDDICREAAATRYSLTADALFFFDPTTVEEIKRMAADLKQAGRKLSENKQWMLGEHKQRCFETIQEARETHDAFWAKRKELSAARRAAHEQRRAENQEKREAWEQRTRDNIAKNREKLSRAHDALSRTRERIREIEGMIYDDTSDKWRSIHGDWLAQAREKESDIEESISRIEGWIREGEDRLYS